jgi:hypothetical protein
MMYVTVRVPARDIRPHDRINGFIAADVTVAHGHRRGSVGACAASRTATTSTPATSRSSARGEDMVPCPECGDPMNEKRLDERALTITQGKCSECVAYPRRHTEQVERERRVAAFGEGRC